MLKLVHELAETVVTEGQMDLVIHNFSKAYDHVPHRRLLEKLNHYGIRGQTHGQIKSFLSDQIQQVIVDRATSEKAPVISGVPQGIVLGPLLFLSLINGLPDCVTSRTRLFADDCIVRNAEACIKHQRDLVSLA